MRTKLIFAGWIAALAAALTGCASGTGPRPMWPLASMLSNEDYPASALRAEEQGTTVVRVDVSAEGKTTGCWVLRSSGSNSLDGATCRLISRRERFHPARDRKGRAVVGSIRQRIVWRIAE